MVDFEELSKKLARQAPINPRDIFQQLPRPVGVGDLYASQAEVLDSWFARRTRRDIVVKQPTGGGKTLIGLLVGQSILNEKHGPVLYLVPTRQLVTQIAAEAAKFVIPIVSYLGGTGGGLPNEFLSSQAICVATYHALFNGRSVFGLTGATLTPIQVAGIILDDAHAAFDIMRESFTFVVPYDAPNSLYLELGTRFKSHFEEISRAGTFEDIIGRKDNGVLEIPYWAWYEKLNEVRGLLRPHIDQLARFVWPLLRDNLEFCHAMISKDAFSITPLLLPLELFPTYANCPSRVYMSATIADDSELIRTFAADPGSVQAPAQSKSLAGVGQRMILVPELMKLPKDVAPQKLTRALLSKAKVQKINALILVSSRLGFEAWKDLRADPRRMDS